MNLLRDFRHRVSWRCGDSKRVDRTNDLQIVHIVSDVRELVQRKSGFPKNRVQMLVFVFDTRIEKRHRQLFRTPPHTRRKLTGYDRRLDPVSAKAIDAHPIAD